MNNESPNKHMQRSVNHKVHGRGRMGLVLEQVCGARVLTRRRAGADVNRWAALVHGLYPRFCSVHC
jgi:hypothetical protein